ncbi:Solute carrier family 25 member 46-B [Fragariocoptes setiger]|uniref:Solute carrier family 25 member 46-B n=1 Tax=Fragariocoptes setiger TaxID=1670756 RepID=A0ABQ7SCT0_9ACAR|nr:Solute carrier family 25 member 46-B [Fragariocoptes setiger]
MYMQGTRTIVDNCDETTVVLPIITNYDGLTDCYQSIVKQEGTLGLYKGLGALFLQFGVRYVIIRTAHYIMRRVMYSRNKTDGGGGINTRISSTPNVMPKFVPAK